MISQRNNSRYFTMSFTQILYLLCFATRKEWYGLMKRNDRNTATSPKMGRHKFGHGQQISTS